MNAVDLTALQGSLRFAVPRRDFLAGLTGLLTGVLAASPEHSEARRKRKRKRKQRNKKNRLRLLVDAQCLKPSNGVAVESEPSGRIAQTFTAIRSGKLVRADLLLSFTIDTPDEFFLHLAPLDAFGFPTNEVLAATSLLAAPSPTGDATMQTFTFQQPGTVVAGKTYALVLSRPEVGTGQWQGHFGNACPGRAFVSVDRTAPFTKVGFLADLIFTAFVRG